MNEKRITTARLILESPILNSSLGTHAFSPKKSFNGNRVFNIIFNL
jgi:hypothetical protein